MHILGKILSVFVIGGAIAGVILTTRVLQIRNEWLTKVEEARGQYEATIDPLDTAKKRVRDLKHDHRVAAYQWHPYWPVLAGDNPENISVQPNVVQTDPANRETWKYGIAINGLGPLSGIRVDDVLHAFAPNDTADPIDLGEDGQIQPTYFLGHFRVTAVIPTPPTITAQALWALRTSEKVDDPQNPGQTVWENATKYKWGDGWRVRLALPGAEPANLLHYAQMLMKKDEQLVATQAYENATVREKSVAEQQLAYRENELHGDANLEQRDLPRYRIDGLVKAISDADETRNVTLEEVDALRHQLKKVYDEVVDLQEKNRNLASKLPGAADVEATTAAKE